MEVTKKDWEGFWEGLGGKEFHPEKTEVFQIMRKAEGSEEYCQPTFTELSSCEYRVQFMFYFGLY